MTIQAGVCVPMRVQWQLGTRVGIPRGFVGHVHKQGCDRGSSMEALSRVGEKKTAQREENIYLRPPLCKRPYMCFLIESSHQP